MTDVTDQPMSRSVSCEPIADVPVLDRIAFEATTAFLDDGATVLYLRTIADRATALQLRLRVSDPLAPEAAELAEEAHTLAGSAGMFGLDRLAAAARSLERAFQVSASNTAAIASNLDSAISISKDIIADLVKALDTLTPTRGTSKHGSKPIADKEWLV